jgi:transcriptional regulator with XRE-family HTH domain
MKTDRSQPTAPQPKRFASVKDLVKATAANDQQVTEFERMLANSVVVNALIRTRADAGMTQADVGEKMECTQSAVSKLEHSQDGDLTIRDMANYLNATGGRLSIGIGKQPNRVEQIKDLAICLKAELEALADLSSNSDDLAIRQNINGFFGEAWFNLFKILCDATSKLPEESEQELKAPFKLMGTKLHKLTVTEKSEKTFC